MYRVNYGNGQVSQTMSSKAEAVRAIAVMDMYREFARIERRTYDGWVRA